MESKLDVFMCIGSTVSCLGDANIDYLAGNQIGKYKIQGRSFYCKETFGPIVYHLTNLDDILKIIITLKNVSLLS